MANSMSALGNQAAPQAAKLLKGYDSMAGRGKIEANRFVFESSQAIDPSSGNPMLDVISVEPSSLKAMGYAGNSPWLSLSVNLLSIDKILNLLQQSAAASGPMAEAQFQNNLAALETGLGMSLRDEIAPALGPEALFSLNTLDLNPMVLFTRAFSDLSADLLIALEVRNKTQIANLMKMIEGRISQQMAVNMAMSATPAPQPEVFRSETYNGVELRLAQLPGQTALSPGYAFHEDFLILGMTADNLKAAINRKNGAQSSMALNSQLVRLRSQFGHGASNGVALLNAGAIVGKIREFAMPMIQMQAAADPNQAMAINGVFDILGTFDTLASSARWTGSSMHKVSEISLSGSAQAQ